MSTVYANLRRSAGRAARSVGLRRRAGTDSQVLRRLPGGKAVIRTGTGKQRTVQYFFIVGFGKSGTNWLGSLLNLHHKVQSAGELNLHGFEDALERFTGKGGGRLGGLEPYRSVSEDAVRNLYERVLTTLLDRKPDATHLGDRTPRPLRAILPGAPMLWIMRDPRDVIVSYTYHYLRLKPEFNILHWSPAVRELFMPFAERFHADPPTSYKTVASELLEESRWVGFVAHQWARQMSADLDTYEQIRQTEPVLQVRYEDLHRNTEKERRSIYEFIGVDPSDADAIESGTNTIAGFKQEDPTSFYRKGSIGDWRNYDTPTFRKKFEEQAGHAAARAGYGDWTEAA